MRLALLLSFFITVLFAGTRAQPNALTGTMGQDPTVTSRQIEKLPAVRTRPRILLPRALKIAENYCKRKRIGLSSYFLFEARMVTSPEKINESHWYFRWVNEKASRPDIEIIVSQQGVAERS